jgi:hypothetical protein
MAEKENQPTPVDAKPQRRRMSRRIFWMAVVAAALFTLQRIWKRRRERLRR